MDDQSEDTGRRRFTRESDGWHSDTDAMSLDDLGRLYGTDKSTEGAEPWMWSRGYTARVYPEYLEPLRHEPITLLELGWGEWSPERMDHSDPELGGRSARMWRDYFDHPAARIVVVDIEQKTNTAPGVLLFQGSQTDPVFLGDLHERVGDYDVVIDDASHVSSKTVAAFKILWPYLKPGGLYFVENIYSSFHRYYFGAQEADPDPGSHATNTAVNFFKRLATEPFYNGLKMKGPAVDGDPRSQDCYARRYWLGYAIESVSFRAPQMIVVRKRTVDRYPPNTPDVPFRRR